MEQNDLILTLSSIENVVTGSEGNTSWIPVSMKKIDETKNIRTHDGTFGGVTFLQVMATPLTVPTYITFSGNRKEMYIFLLTDKNASLDNSQNIIDFNCVAAVIRNYDREKCRISPEVKDIRQFREIDAESIFIRALILRLVSVAKNLQRPEVTKIPFLQKVQNLYERICDVVQKGNLAEVSLQKIDRSIELLSKFGKWINFLCFRLQNYLTSGWRRPFFVAESMRSKKHKLRREKESRLMKHLNSSR